MAGLRPGHPRLNSTLQAQKDAQDNKPGHDAGGCGSERWRAGSSFSMMYIIAKYAAGNSLIDDKAAPTIVYPVTPTEVMASLAGIAFGPAIFDGTRPPPPLI